jgi:hypothetical protein
VRLRFLMALAAFAVAAQTVPDGPQFLAGNQLVLPKNYREWVFLSSGLGMTYGPAAEASHGSPTFDNVFVNPAAYRYFQTNGHWPDKTMFILEVRSATGKGSINNGGNYQSAVLAVESAVKDERRFPEKWAYFGFGRGDKARPLPGNSSCNACHSQNAAVENSFVQFYPTLLEVATAKGTLNRSYLEKASGK